MSTLSADLQSLASSALLSRWQTGDAAAVNNLHAVFNAVIEGQYDAVFQEPAPTDSVCVTTSVHLMTLALLNQLYGLISSDFYKCDPHPYVRTTLMLQRLLGIRKLTLHWPVNVFGAEALWQIMMYPDKHAPGVDSGEPQVDRMNWCELRTMDFEGVVPQVIEEMLVYFTELTGREPVVHLPAPYSLAADIFGLEVLVSVLIEEPDFVVDFIVHLTEMVLVPWCERLSRRFSKMWLELSDASGSPLFIGPRLFQKFAALPFHRLIRNFPWGKRVFVANYRGDVPVRQAGGNGRHQRSGRRARRGKIGSVAESAIPATDALVELIDFKLSLCLEFIIKPDADQAPLSIYVEQTIRRGKPLTLGIGATHIDRNSIVDHDGAEQELEGLATKYAQAIKKVSETLALNEHPLTHPPCPCGVSIEDINAESDFDLVKIIVEAVAIHGKIVS